MVNAWEIVEEIKALTTRAIIQNKTKSITLAAIWLTMGQVVDATCPKCLYDAHRDLRRINFESFKMRSEMAKQKKVKRTLLLKEGKAIRWAKKVYTRDTLTQEIAELWIGNNPALLVHFDESQPEEKPTTKTVTTPKESE